MATEILLNTPCTTRDGCRRRARSAAEQSRIEAANAPATRAGNWRAKFTDSRQGILDYFERVEERRRQRTLDLIQSALDAVAFVAPWVVPGAGPVRV